MKQNVYTIFLLALLLPVSINADWKDKVIDAKDKVKDAISEKTDELPSNVSNYGQAVKELVMEKTEGALEKLHENLIELNKAGFRADEVWIEGTLTPTITVIFEDVGETGKEDDVLRDSKDKIILSSTLKMLLNTRKFKMKHYQIKKLKLEYSIPPKLTLQATVNDL